MALTVEDEGPSTIENRNPATSELLGRISEIDDVGADAVIARAFNAFESWRLVPAPRRADLLFRAAALMRQRRERLAATITAEMGKIGSEALGEVDAAIDVTYFMAGEGRRLTGIVVPSEVPNRHAMAERHPIGVVAAITPWNFSLAIPVWKLMPALVAGNTCILKPSTESPQIAADLLEVLLDAGVPEGVVNLTIGHGASVGERLVGDARVGAVSFTGSLEAGRRVNATGAPLMKRLLLELGGKNAVIVLPDADLDAAADSIIDSAFGLSGQRCTAASRVIVDRRVHDALASRIVARAERLRVGPGSDPNSDLGPVVSASSLRKVDSYADARRGIAVKEGARVLTGGEVAADGPLADGFFYRPTVLADVDVESRTAQEEIFGPVTALISCDGLTDAIAKSNQVPFGLSSAIFTRDVRSAFVAARDLQAGVTSVNAGTGASEVHLPFGGWKLTGNGQRECGPMALDTFTEWKSVYVDYSPDHERAPSTQASGDAHAVGMR